MIRIVTLLLIGCCLSGQANAVEPWRIASDNAFPPYAYLDSANKPAGLDTEIVEAVMRRLGEPYDLKMVPWERVKYLLDNKQIDMAFQFVKTPEREARYRLVGPFRSGLTVLIVREDSDIQAARLTDLRGYLFGTVHGYAYTKEFDSAQLQRDDKALNPSQLIRKLLLGRVDIIIGDKTQILHAARLMGEEEKLRVLEPPLAESARFVGFPKDSDKADRFEMTLNELIRSGEIQVILNRWK
ncbi:transporter substrate-binding domain-containing protein [Chitinivorax sp. B]|uniref:substrate-binding periplasmic protein n=1 Tax=Chitinivorax sp. B TaxID=2502235 RepID=UPI0014853404|nr:transporter substrate-binding domain-containing protein [Chitinivorax sp. B]